MFLILGVFSLACNAVLWALIILNLDTLYQEGREFIPLHYKVPIGPDFYSSWYGIFVLPIAGILFAVFNFFFSRFLYNHQRVMAYLLMTVAFLCQIIFIRAAYLIIQINLF